MNKLKNLLAILICCVVLPIIAGTLVVIAGLFSLVYAPIIILVVIILVQILVVSY